MTAEKLQEILRKHKLWLEDNPDGEKADLSWANLSWANLSGANLSGANLSWANLSGANLTRADLSWANLSGANLSGANLSGANLTRADLISSVDFMEAHFERTEAGYIAYKCFGGQYKPPKEWDIKPGAVISETVNPLRTCDCGSGINVAPLDWVRRNYPGKEIWKVLIRWEWLPGVVCPYNSDGKIRCERVELVEVVQDGKM